MKLQIVFSLLLATGVKAFSVPSLTPDNWDELTAGKTIFLKFFAPWCGHCKKLKPDWDKLIDAFLASETALVADVDCTADGKPLCEDHGIRGFPTLKNGDPSALEDYQGGRDFGSLKKFADENLKPMCSPTNIDLCDAEKKAEIEKIQAMPDADLEAAIAEKVKMVEEAEETFKNGVEALQAQYQKLMENKEETVENIKNSGLGLMKAVKATKAKKSGSDEL